MTRRRAGWLELSPAPEPRRGYTETAVQPGVASEPSRPSRPRSPTASLGDIPGSEPASPDNARVDQAENFLSCPVPVPWLSAEKFAARVAIWRMATVACEWRLSLRALHAPRIRGSICCRPRGARSGGREMLSPVLSALLSLLICAFFLSLALRLI